MRIARNPFSGGPLVFSAIVLFPQAFLAEAATDTGIDPLDLSKKVEAAYARVKDYRIRTAAEKTSDEAGMRE